MIYNSSGFSSLSVTQKFGKPWSVKEATIKADGSYRSAVVVATFTYQRSYDNQTGESEQQISEPAETTLEWQNGTWYWAKEPAQYAQGQASCAYNP